MSTRISRIFALSLLLGAAGLSWLGGPTGSAPGAVARAAGCAVLMPVATG